MHKILKRQLKKSSLDNDELENQRLKKLLKLVNQTYVDADDDRDMLENTIATSSSEMKELYKKLQLNAQKQINESEQKYFRLAENVKHHYFFYTYNKDGLITYVSDSITNMLGYDVLEFQTHYTKYLSDDEVNNNIDEYMKKSISGKRQDPYEINIYHKNGVKKYLEMTEIAHCDENGNVIDIEGIARDITSYYDSATKLNYIATHDALTGLPNRMSLYTKLETFIENSNRDNSKFALLFLDLDKFKNINDTLGHHIGDELLKDVTKRVLPNIRKGDVLARLGGDEFVILLKIKEENIINIVNKILELFHFTWEVDNQSLKISSSIGVSIYPDDANNKDNLIKNADIAMYKAKKNGRNKFYFFTEKLNTEVQEHIQLEKDMIKAIDNKEFELYYQPKVNTDTKQIVGAEALIRWNHPTKGLVPPDKFIPLSEKNGLIKNIGNWVIEQSCKDINYLNSLNLKGLKISINISIKQFESRVSEEISKNISKYNVDPSQLCIEVTETSMMKDEKTIFEQLHSIKSLGISIYMDDFGMGYSSLSYIHKLPIDTLKIDKSFIDKIDKDNSSIILDTIIVMSKTLNLNIIAEGVEEEFQRKYLLNKGCNCFQGYLVSKPLPMNDFLKLV